jgi:N-carbamoylputrescine amidase
MRIAATELSDNASFDAVSACLNGADASLVVLNELPFGTWLAASEQFDPDAAMMQARMYEQTLAALVAQTTKAFVTTRCRIGGARLVNEAVVGCDGRLSPLHQKAHFPQEPGFYEQSWFEVDSAVWQPSCFEDLRLGALICTELMFTEYARRYAAMGCDVIVVPRCSGGSENWLVAGRMAALASGCYVVSSNRSGIADDGQTFGGGGFIIAPGGEVLARTTSDEPIIYAEIDVARVREAQASYPCYLTLGKSDTGPPANAVK